MKFVQTKNQGGFGHVGIIVAVVVALAVGATGWFVWQKQKDSYSSTTDKAIQEAIKNAKCDYDDKDLCKFFTTWDVQKYYTVTSVSETDGKKTTTVAESEGSSKTHIKISGELNYEVITIGNDTYTKAGNGTWWKQTAKNEAVDETVQQYKETTEIDLVEPTDDTTADQTNYKLIGKEKCGDLTCFKYQEINPTDTTTSSFIWFDDEDYQLRRTLMTSKDGTTYESTFSYEKVSVKVPSPVKNLAENQYLIPGQDEPVTLPAAGDTMPTDEELKKLMEQYQ